MPRLSFRSMKAVFICLIHSTSPTPSWSCQVRFIVGQVLGGCTLPQKPDTHVSVLPKTPLELMEASLNYMEFSCLTKNKTQKGRKQGGKESKPLWVFLRIIDLGYEFPIGMKTSNVTWPSASLHKFAAAMVRMWNVSPRRFMCWKCLTL